MDVVSFLTYRLKWRPCFQLNSMLLAKACSLVEANVDDIPWRSTTIA